MNNLDFEKIKNNIQTKGWSGPHKLFDEDELNNIYNDIKYKYKNQISINHDINVVKALENIELKVEKNTLQKSLMYESIFKFAKKNKIKDAFTELLESKNIFISNFTDFRINFAGKSVPKATGWHQDIETHYLEKRSEFGKKSLAMWVSLTRSDHSNSVEFVNSSHKDKIIYDMSYKDREKSILDILDNKNLKFEKFSSSPGEVVFIDPFVIHRSVVTNSSYTRFSIDLRYVSQDVLENYKFFGNKLRLRKLIHNLKKPFIYIKINILVKIKKFIFR